MACSPRLHAAAGLVRCTASAVPAAAATGCGAPWGLVLFILQPDVAKLDPLPVPSDCGPGAVVQATWPINEPWGAAALAQCVHRASTAACYWICCGQAAVQPADPGGEGARQQGSLLAWTVSGRVCALRMSAAHEEGERRQAPLQRPHKQCRQLAGVVFFGSLFSRAMVWRASRQMRCSPGTGHASAWFVFRPNLIEMPPPRPQSLSAAGGPRRWKLGQDTCSACVCL
jgi:hypothetical protein